MKNCIVRVAGVFMLLLAGAIVSQAQAADIDTGVFRVSRSGKAIGFERFYYDQYADSVVVESIIRQVVQTPRGPDSLQKVATLYVAAFDLDLRHYESTEKVAGSKLLRALMMSDTAFTSYREYNGHGEGEVLVRPPGRLYVHDPEVYSLFDVISRNLHRQEFDSRPITLFVLGPTDTTVEITATKLGKAPLRWGGRTLQAGRMKLDDGHNQLTLWSDARGRLLRLEDASGLRVVRDPPPVKPVARRKKPAAS